MENLQVLRRVIEAGYTRDLPVIERAWADVDPILRSAALGSFHRAGCLTFEQILRGLADPKPAVRRRAAELASRMDFDHTEGEPTKEERQAEQSITSALDQALNDEREVAEMAAFALGEIGSAPGPPLHTSIISHLETMALHHPDPLCREQAIASLGALHSSCSVILDALHDKATVRRRAIIALSPFDGPRVEAALRQALEDRDWQVRQAAEDQLG